MPEKRLDVVIVGGSLAGLMQGIVIKRLGHNVTILEQHLSSTREGQAAGIATMEYGQAFLSAHDRLQEQPYAVAVSGVQFLDKNLKVVGGYDIPLRMTSWNVLYYRLRANFDGLTSAYCPTAPADSPEDGKVIYDQGKRMTNVEYSDGRVKVEFEDLVDKGAGSGYLCADIAIAADGSTSGMRQILQPELKHMYAGYVAWRGTVLESDVSDETKNTFGMKTTFHVMRRGYIVLYIIPGKDGSLQPGQRLLNYVWYTNYAENSPELKETMTDVNGRQHRNTLPIGKMRSEVWDQQKVFASKVLPAPFAELVNKTRQPFISSITDIGVSQPSLFDGKLLFIGDALVPFRPHVACSTNQAALNALLVEKMLKGEISLSEWKGQVTAYAHLTRLRSITWGSWYQFGYIAFFFSEARYRLAGYAQALRKYWYG